MLLPALLWVSSISFALAELSCDWEYLPGGYLADWATGEGSTVFGSLALAQSRCVELGDNCGGVTLMTNNRYTVREGSELVQYDKENSWRKTCGDGDALFRVSSISPSGGSRTGGTRITITGQGFSTNQFGYDDPSLGNQVTFYHDSDTYSPVVCSVLTYYTSSTKLVCDMAKPDNYYSSSLEYRMKVSVDGTWMEPTSTNIYCGWACRFWFSYDQTPYIDAVEEQHVPAGSVVSFSGRMWSADFEANEDQDEDQDSFISRVYLNSYTCDTSDDDGVSYGTALATDDDGEDTTYGTVYCRSENPGATSYRPSYLNSERGRSEVTSSVNKVDSQMQKYALQTYNVLYNITPAEGSTAGGTLITIRSQHINGPESNIEVEVGGSTCELDSFSSTQIICKSPAVEAKSLYPGNRGVTVEYWAKEDDVDSNTARYRDVDEIRNFTQNDTNFLFENVETDTHPSTLTDLGIEYQDVPYYVRMKFFLNIQETDEYGFHMVSEHSGKLYVSTDEDPENIVELASCTSWKYDWNTLQTDVNVTLQAGQVYYVEFVGVMWRYNQRCGVGLTKKSTQFQTHDVATSRVEYPYWYWDQDYKDEIQEVDLGALISTPAVGFQLQLGARQTSTLYASSSADTIAAAITETAVYECPTLDAADAWYSIGYEEGTTDNYGFRFHARTYIKPYCGRRVAINTWNLFQYNYDVGQWEWDATGAYKWICFAIQTTQPRVSLYYELKYQDSNYNWQARGIWRGGDDMFELKDNDGAWKYNCVNMYERVTLHDWEAQWESRIGSRSWKIKRVLLGVDTTTYGYYSTDAIHIFKSNTTEEARVEGFGLEGEGLLETVTVAIADYCSNGSDCTGSSEAAGRKWTISMDTFECGYDFPLVAVAGAAATVLQPDTLATYLVGDVSVAVNRTSSITTDLQGTFDLTIDGVTHKNIDVHIDYDDLMEIVNTAGDYAWAHKWGNCYERHWRLQRKTSGHYGWHSVNSTNVVGLGEVTTVVMFRSNERGGLVMTPLYGDWIRTVHSQPQVTVKVAGIQASCENETCAFNATEELTPTVTGLDPAYGSAALDVALTGSGFGTDLAGVSVTLGGVPQTVTAVSDQRVEITIAANVAQVHSDIVLHVAGKGNAAISDAITFTFEGSVDNVGPVSGSVGGGTLITITGTGFSSSSEVTFGGEAGTVISANFTEIQVRTPGHSAVGDVSVAITGETGYNAPAVSTNFSYHDSDIAKVNGISPSTGSVVGGDNITLSGENLDTSAEDGVTIGGVVCTEITKTSTEYMCTTGASYPGENTIVLLTDSDEYAESAVTFTYTLEVYKMSPDSGSVVGGTVVTIQGAGFGTDSSLLSVSLGEFACTVTEASDTVLYCTTEGMLVADQVYSQHVESSCTGSVTSVQAAAQDSHNMYRSWHDTNDLCYSTEVAATASSWATYLAQNDMFKSSTSSYRLSRGENIMMYEHYDVKSDEAYMRDAVAAWYSEMDSYSAADPSSALHYTQVVWGLTTEVGCAVVSARDEASGYYKVYVVCHYSPTGNTEGKFVDLVQDFDTSNHEITNSLPSKSTAVSVFLNSYKAVAGSENPASPEADCQPLAEDIAGCDNEQAAAAGGDINFDYSSCRTPTVTNVTRQVSWDQDITVTGTGFTTQACAITVRLGSSHLCTVSSSTTTQIVCVPDISTEPTVYTLFEVRVNILGLGDSIFDGEDFDWAYTSITPRITAITPSDGSGQGGTTIEIAGGGFKYEDNDIAGLVSDGVSNFEVLSATYTSLSVRSLAGLGAAATEDTVKNITLTQDDVAVACDACEFTYLVSETAAVSGVAPLTMTGAATVTINGTLLCPGGSGTTVEVGESACTIVNCTDSQITCEIGVLPAGTYALSVYKANGYAEIPEELSSITSQFTVASVSPVEGSLFGGTVVTITGNALPTTDLRVKSSSYYWTVISNTVSEIVVATPNREVTVDEVDQIRLVTVDGTVTGIDINYTYKTSLTPTITMLSENGTLGTEITIIGEHLNVVNATDVGNVNVTLAPSDSCLKSDDTEGSDYRGTQSSTVSGTVCQMWTSQSPNQHTNTPENKPDAGLGDHNFCRNPDGEDGGPWCYSSTSANDPRWEYCVVPDCSEGWNECEVVSASETEIVCTLDDNEPGNLTLTVHVEGLGYSSSDQELLYLMSLAGTSPAAPLAGSLGGPTITLLGAGFSSEEDKLNVTICGVAVPFSRTSYQELEVQLPACPDCTEATSTCHVTVSSGDETVTLPDHVTYNSGLTPSISDIDPDNAGTGGGKAITITGTGFSDSVSGVSVLFDKVECTVQNASVTQIVCITGAKADLSSKAGVEVRVSDSLALNPAQKGMVYMDKWSSIYTWGGQVENVPVEGDLVGIVEGQIIYLDISPPLLKAVVINGGHLVFDDSDDITLKSEYILILSGGSLTIGTEDEPFTHEGIVEMHGHQQSTELPLYGAKTLAVRNGTVEMHGVEVTPKWCELGESAAAGASSIVIDTQTNWQVGDDIAISSSSFSPSENEDFSITSVSYDSSTGKTSLGLDGALAYNHISLVQTIRGVEIRTAAKVGHLTRNVKMRGNVNEDHLEAVDACPQEFDPDQFATQTCFQGRYGDELDSDQFGSQLMFHAAAMGTREVHGRLENVEFTWAGQAFRLGRYPIHFHMNGDVAGSYVKGCAIHHTFNRAVTVHGVDNLVVQDNVAYNNMGHAFFLEDGGEEDNSFIGNLAIFTKTSSSLLNVDITPASFWIVNPQNTFVNNTAAGSTHFGFWFNPPAHPGGPSATDAVCPRNKGLKLFTGNEAHSCGRYGIWVWEHWDPKGDGSCEATTPNITTISHFHGWHNLKGVEVEDGSALRFDNMLLNDNWESQFEVHKCQGATFEEGNTRLTNSQLFAKTESSTGMVMGYKGPDEFVCGVGVLIPGKGMFSVINTTFHDFTDCVVFEACGGCKPRQGGFVSEYSGIAYENSPLKAKFQWEFEAILRDLDGTLAGEVGGIVSPNMAILDDSSCAVSAEWSQGDVDGAVCNSDTNLIRIAWNEPSLEYLLFKSVNISNSFGLVQSPWVWKRMTHMKGWMATIPTGHTYRMQWDTDLTFTNASYQMSAYYPQDGDYVILEQVLADKPDYITVGGSSNKKDSAVASTDDAGTFTFDDETETLSHLITGKGVFLHKELPMDLKVYKCYYENCTDPHPTPLPSNPTIQERPETPKYWSVSSDWAGTEAGYGGYNGYLPLEGQDVMIPSSWWMVYDANVTGLGTIYVYGVLEFTSAHDTLLGANTILVVGGKLVVGWKEEPLSVRANIVLTGSREDDEYTLNDGTNVGSKALAIIGYAEIHAEYPAVVWSIITEPAAAGDTALTLRDNVQGMWKVGDEIVIASTSFLPYEAENRTITAVEGHTLSLDRALEYEHDYLLEEVNGFVYERAAEVGLLTRLITIEGAIDAGHEQQYGARVLVSDYSQINEAGEREDYIPIAQIQGVRFKNTGQLGYRDDWDPRYSLAFKNTLAGGDQSYIKGCSLDNGFNHGFGILQSHNVAFLDNVIYTTLGSGMRTTSDNTDIQGNLVINVLHYGNYESPIEEDNVFTDACFDTWKTASVTMKNNNCGGSERAGFSTQAEDSGSNEWEDNVAHGCLWGFFIRRSTMDVAKLNKVSIWQSYDYGVVHYSTSSLEIENSVLADNWVSVLALVIGPNPLTHVATDKYVSYSNTLVYGRNPDSECDERSTHTTPTAQRTGLARHAPTAANGGRLGMYLSNFVGGFGGWPKKPIQNLMTYSSIKGSTTLSGVTFANFDRCDDLAMMDLRGNGDCLHPTKLAGMSYSGVDMLSNLLLLNDPQLGLVNSADCVDMPCDAKKKVLIVDSDGSTFDTAGTSLVSRAEFEWDSADERWGMGDYRIPNQMTTALNGSYIDPDNWPYKGIDRNQNNSCSFATHLNMYKCTGVTYKMLVIESLDGDTETRRLSPLALASEDGSVDLINGPMDHGWCGGYTCQQRISTFYAMVITNKIYKLYMTSTQPQSLRYYLVDATASDKIRLDVWYAKSQRLDMYYQGSYKPPTNAERLDDGSYSYATELTAEQLYPTLASNDPGQNFFDSAAHTLSMLLQGPDPFTIKTSPKIVLSLSLESVSVDEFFDSDKIIANLAALLGIDESKIKIANIVSEGKRRKREGITELEIEISEPAIESEDEMDVGAVTDMAQALTDASQIFVQTVQTGGLSAALEVEVSAVSVQLPQIPAADSRNATLDPDEAAMVTETTYAEAQAAEEASNIESLASIAILIPDSYQLISSTDEAAMLANLAIASKVTTSEDQVVALLGAGSGKWRATATVVSGPGRLLGSAEVELVGGYANLTLRLSRAGSYSLKLAVTHPADLAHQITGITVLVTEQAADSPYSRVKFTFNADYEEVVQDPADFTAYITALLEQSFPDVVFADVDHYAGSLVVEATVSTSANTKQGTASAIEAMTAAVNDPDNGLQLSYGGKTIGLAGFSGDAATSEGGSSTAVIVAAVLAVLAAAGLAGAGFLYYKKRQARALVGDSHQMRTVKHVDSDPTLERQQHGSNIYHNPAANCESQLVVEQSQVAATVYEKQERLRNLRKRSLSGRRDSPDFTRLVESVETLDEETLEGSRHHDNTETLGNWRQRAYNIAECSTCGESKKTWPCPICGGPRYCSKLCLDKNWPEHHTDCRPRSGAPKL